MSILHHQNGTPLRSTSTRVQSVVERIIDQCTSEELADLLELVYDEYRNRGGSMKIDAESFSVVVER